jgi:hypothetical protein
MPFTPIGFRIPDELAPWRSLTPIRDLPRAILYYTIRLDGHTYIVKYGALYDPNDNEFVGVLQEEVVENKQCYKIHTSYGYMYYEKNGSFFGRRDGDVIIKDT